MAKYSKREFRVGDYWLSQRSASQAWNRTFYDEEAKQTRRVSLGTSDFEVAKAQLFEWYTTQRMRTQQDIPAEEVRLKDVFAEYLENRGKLLRSYKSAIIILRYWEEFYVNGTVSDVRDVRRQEQFREALAAKGLAVNSINRVLEAGRAAINRAYKRNVITSAPYIHTLPYERDTPKGRPLSSDEIGQLYSQAADHMRLFTILMIGTAARNEAICHLEWQQIDFEEGLIHLNPDGRKQTNKRRPTVRLVPFVREVLEPLRQKQGRVIMFRGKSIDTAYQGIGKAVGRTQLQGHVTAYSFRHTAARWLRKSGVSPWETAMQLGHKVVGFSVTERYAAWSPDYLQNASKALDELLRLSIPLDATPIQQGR